MILDCVMFHLLAGLYGTGYRPRYRLRTGGTARHVLDGCWSAQQVIHKV